MEPTHVEFVLAGTEEPFHTFYAHNLPCVGEAVQIQSVVFDRTKWSEELLQAMDAVVGHTYRVLKISHVYRWRPGKPSIHMAQMVVVELQSDRGDDDTSLRS